MEMEKEWVQDVVMGKGEELEVVERGVDEAEMDEVQELEKVMELDEV